MIEDLLRTLGLSIDDSYDIYAIGNDGCANGACNMTSNLICAVPPATYGACPLQACVSTGHFKDILAVP